MSRESDLRELQEQAGTAYGLGQPVFVARLKLGGVWGGVPEGALPAWGESVYTVEAAGWVLDKWTVTTDTSGGFNAFPVFRRREAWTPQDRPAP
jgi:hypothetical protein